MKPLPNEYQPFYQNYIDTVATDNEIVALDSSAEEILSVLKNIPDDQGTYFYAPGKWSLLELTQHMIDCEIIFLARALRVARKDKTDLPGFEQDDYVAASNANKNTLSQLVQILEHTMRLTRLIFSTFSTESFAQTSTINGGPMSVRALAFIISGHRQHHARIIKERYL